MMPIKWLPGMKQVFTTCIKCGGPGVTTEEESAKAGQNFVHCDINVCKAVERNSAKKAS
jgi:hypothetical protein